MLRVPVMSWRLSLETGVGAVLGLAGAMSLLRSPQPLRLAVAATMIFAGFVLAKLAPELSLWFKPPREINWIPFAGRMHSLYGFSEMLADKTFGDLNPRQLKYANNIMTSGRHLLQLINDILDLSKVEAGRLELVRSWFDIGKALQDVQAIVRTLAGKKGISLNFDVARELPPLFADEAKFKQILYNLLSNAIKFTPDGGRVSVAASLQSDGTESPVMTSEFGTLGTCLKVCVADTGIGIHSKDHERIFLEFEQVDWL